MKAKMVYVALALALAVPLLSLNVALADPGDIGDVIDRLEVDPLGHQPSMTHVSGNVYAIAYKSISGDLTTVEISAAGDSIAVLDTQGLTYDGTMGDWPSIVRVSDDVVAVAFKGTDAGGRLETYELDTNPSSGTYGDITFVDFLKFAGTCKEPSMTHVSGDVYAIAYKSSSGDLTTVEISAAGDSIAILDTQGLTYDGDNGDQPSIARVSDDVVAVAFKGYDAGVWLETYELDTNPSSGTYGDITFVDFLKFAGAGHHPSMTHVSGDVYAIAYKSSSGDLTTVDIDTSGSITDPELYAQGLTNDVDKGDHPSIVRISDDVVAVAFKGTADVGWLETYELDTDPSSGTYGDITFVASLAFDEVKGDQPSMIYAANGVYAIAYKGGLGESLHLVTVGITTPTPTPTPGEGGDGCFIATAAYGTESAEEIDVLRAFRDEVLLENSLGSQLVALYYEVSPPVADFIAEHEGLRTLVRELLVDPVVWVVDAIGSLWRN